MKKQVLTFIAIIGLLNLYAQDFSFKNINYWVGKGTDTTALLVDFKDGKPAVAFGYLFNGTKTGTDLLMAVQKEYPNFNFTTGFGFLNDIYFFEQKGEAGKPNWFSTFSKNDANEWIYNDGLSSTLAHKNWYACVYNPYPTDDEFPSKNIINPLPVFNQTTAILASDTKIKNWVSKAEIVRGWQDIANESLGKASHGIAENALGAVTSTSPVVSLGDGGYAILTFPKPIMNGEGPDFAVFENSFSDTYLEIAFVEVSSDGQNFFRFPAISLTQTNTQIGGFDNLDPTKIHNLAGKFKKTFGTPFDLEELKGINGLDINNIIAVKIIDVIGTINSQFASYDSKGNIINEPYTTGFASSGFDLDGVAVLNEKTITNTTNQLTKEDMIFPTRSHDFITVKAQDIQEIIITNSNGVVVSKTQTTDNEIIISVQDLQAGLYLVSIIKKDNRISSKKLIVE